MRLRPAGLVVFLFFLALPAGLVGSEEDVAQSTKPKSILPVQKVKPGKLNGLIQASDGKRMAGVKIEIVNAKGRVVGSGNSNKYGMYQIKNLPEGEYTLKVGDQHVVKLHVTRQATVSSLKIVMPLKGSGLTPLAWTRIVVGGAAVVVGTIAIVHNSGGSTGGTISP